MAARGQAWRAHLAIALVQLLALGLIGWRLRDPRAGAVRIEPPPTLTPAPSPSPLRLRVHVSGAVARPSVVSLPEGARAGDAVRAAGGFAPEAAQAAVNLAAPLGDGQQLHVPSQAELEGVGALGGPPVGPAAGVAREPPGMPGAPSSLAGGNPGLAAGPPAAAGSGASGPGIAADGRIDVNRAGAAELEALPGIGPALAARIVAHRGSQGPFRQAGDLLAVPGIGEKTLARFADQIIVR